MTARCGNALWLELVVDTASDFASQAAGRHGRQIAGLGHDKRLLMSLH